MARSLVGRRERVLDLLCDGREGARELLPKATHTRGVEARGALTEEV